MKIAFHSNQISERGTEVALYDYAHFNEEILSNKSIIISNKQNKNNSTAALNKFKGRFKTLLYNDTNEIDQLLANEGVDVLYTMKAGTIDNILSSRIKTVVHCMFNLNEPHGDVYASVSSQLNKRFNTAFPVVPYIVQTPDYDGDLRSSLHIPKDAIVIGRHGGFNTFDIEFVHKTIKTITQNHINIYFLLMNTAPFYKSWFRRQHKQIIHLPPSVNMKHKIQFINTCDAMLHARSGGETFGLAVAEFSIKNKPVITWKPRQHINNGRYYDDAHLDMLGEKALTYSNQQDLYEILTTINPDTLKNNNWDAYSKKYAPEVVMKLFDKYFIKN